MKEIKFRAWNGKEMSQPQHLYSSFWHKREKEIKELMQYTGLKDKNGKEIYERDIVKTTSGFIGEILFYDGAFMGNFNPISEIIEGFEVVLNLKEVRNRRMEIIGNIYENPELTPNQSQ